MKLILFFLSGLILVGCNAPVESEHGPKAKTVVQQNREDQTGVFKIRIQTPGDRWQYKTTGLTLTSDGRHDVPFSGNRVTWITDGNAERSSESSNNVVIVHSQETTWGDSNADILETLVFSGEDLYELLPNGQAQFRKTTVHVGRNIGSWNVVDKSPSPVELYAGQIVSGETRLDDGRSGRYEATYGAMKSVTVEAKIQFLTQTGAINRVNLA